MPSSTPMLPKLEVKTSALRHKSVCICMHVCTHVRTYVLTYLHTYIHTLRHTYISQCAMYIYICICICICIHTHKYTWHIYNIPSSQGADLRATPRELCLGCTAAPDGAEGLRRSASWLAQLGYIGRLKLGLGCRVWGLKGIGFRAWGLGLMGPGVYRA